MIVKFFNCLCFFLFLFLFLSVIKIESKIIMTNKYDVIVWGATGFTGQLCAEYFSTSCKSVKFAIAGRNRNKLEDVQRHILRTIGTNVDILSAQLDDPKSLDDLCMQAQVILSTAGPYTLLGTPLIEACLRNGVHYVDITGEVPWVRKVIDKYQDDAIRKQVKIVNCCGYDCIPADIGCMMAVNKMVSIGLDPKEVRLLVLDGKGAVSGGTIASMMEIMSQPASVLAEASSPFALCPRDQSTGSPSSPSDPTSKNAAADQLWIRYDRTYSAWTMPYVMQFVDTRIVARSNALKLYKYGKNFVFSEGIVMPIQGFLGALTSALVTLGMGVASALFSFGPTRNLLKKYLPKPGEGPSKEMREKGYQTFALWGKGLDSSKQERLVYGGLTVMGGDPGYGQTSKMVCEAALCLVEDKELLPKTFGILTPSAAFGEVIVPRLKKVGVDFFFADSPQAVRDSLSATVAKERG